MTRLPASIPLPVVLAVIVAACAGLGIPVVTRGAGTGLSGGANAVDGCLVLDLSRMNKILEIDTDNMIAVVPPGATTIYIGGQNAVDGDGTLIGGDDVATQTQQVMKNLHIALAAAGASVKDLVMMTVLFVDGVDLAAAYPVAAAELAGAAAPVVGVRVAGLAVPGALVEVSAVAAVSS